eukprot:10820-Heterococcus_DN1.PRE.11
MTLLDLSAHSHHIHSTTITLETSAGVMLLECGDCAGSYTANKAASTSKVLTRLYKSGAVV